MRSVLSIGDFARITHLSLKTLRHYHDAGLLEPDQVDPQSGYRSHATMQIPSAQVIRRLRDLDMPVREVGEVLATTDPHTRSALIADHLHRLASGHGALRSARRHRRHLRRAGQLCHGTAMRISGIAELVIDELEKRSCGQDPGGI